MLQLTQKLSNGDMKITELPMPKIGKYEILVKNYFSLISSGTESSTVSAARKNLISKAKERPQQVKQVLNSLQNQGLIKTMRAVNKKLDSYSPLGYSSSGEVIKIGSEVKTFKVGDYVACSGVGYANHSEYVSVPENLSVKIKSFENLKNASYNTLGAISMQSVRQASLNIGESCLIIGLGLLGQITAQILMASGVRVIGVDINEDVVNKCINSGIIDFGLIGNTKSEERKILEYTDGFGCDAVIIAAASSSKKIINFAGASCRKKGKVVLLGDVPVGFSRNPHWYKKELELKMSCSYGPGRYDINYEERSIDYPYAYVRWSQKRNMQAFQELIDKNKISLDILTTHEFKFKDSVKAYDLLLSTEYSCGIILKYDTSKKYSSRKIIVRKTVESNKSLNISFIGAGSYAQSNLLPYLSNKDISKVGVLTSNGTTSKRVSEKFNFNFCTSEFSDICNSNTNTLFIATISMFFLFFLTFGFHHISIHNFFLSMQDFYLKT